MGKAGTVAQEQLPASVEATRSQLQLIRGSAKIGAFHPWVESQSEVPSEGTSDLKALGAPQEDQIRFLGRKERWASSKGQTQMSLSGS